MLGIYATYSDSLLPQLFVLFCIGIFILYPIVSYGIMYLLDYIEPYLIQLEERHQRKK